MANIPTREEMYESLKERHGESFAKNAMKAKVAICGLGGLGSNIAIALARAGVGNLTLIDFDKVDISNLNRQQYKMTQIGMNKTDALRENLKEISPYCNIKINTVKINKDNIEELLEDVDIVCEAFDKATQKAMLVNEVLEKMPSKYLITGSGMASNKSANLIKTRRISKRFYICGDEISDVDKENGLFASRVLVCAAHEAHMVIRIISEEYEP